MPIARPSGEPAPSASASAVGSMRVAGIDFEIFSPRTVHQPCARIAFGSGSLAAIRNAGQYTAVEAQDVLADDVDRVRPVALDVGAADLSVLRTEVREVVRERVHPHVDHVREPLGIRLGHRDAPREALCATTLRSLSPPFRNATISLRYASGRMKSGFCSMCASSGLA